MNMIILNYFLQKEIKALKKRIEGERVSLANRLISEDLSHKEYESLKLATNERISILQREIETVEEVLSIARINRRRK